MDETWGRERPRCFKSLPTQFQTVPDGSATDLHWFTSGLLVLFVGENRLSSCRFWFSVDGTWGRGHSHPCKVVFNGLQTVSARTLKDLLQFPSGLQVLFFCREQIVNVWSLILNGWNIRQGAFQVFQINSHTITSSSRWICDRSTLIHVWTTSGFMLAGEQTVKLWILISSEWNFRQGVFKLF